MTEYNGWTNYETWCIKLWLDNDQYTEELMREMTQDIADKEFPESTLADYIKDFTEENMPEIENSVYLDLLQSAIHSANYHEIAKSYLDDYNSELDQVCDTCGKVLSNGDYRTNNGLCEDCTI